MLCILPDIGVQTFEQKPGAIVPAPPQVVSEFFQALNAIRNSRKTSCSHLVMKAEPALARQTALKALDEVLDLFISRMPYVTDAEDHVLHFP